ncbi:MAG: molybdopterin-synthase adenylyltransferase MoeB [Spongiibacter sp.]|uniref:HesA/MoeB/ThiF family protein n=1 Tax=Spongiibacter thalassae TaxID=2721624 RepID=UPI001B2FEC38|nr:molybdopterin-synthase adenylyltransferase MoeB [Spongiibacter thalassae]MDX1504202.1 molybdopterin-synthase adenylyltransferase MoeB [Spongiibacter sp.]
MNNQQLLRYSRHILLPALDVEGQAKLLASRALIVGMGGLGSPVAMYLAASGVGVLQLVDDDEVELSNLQRQIAHGNADIGRSKVASAAATVAELNPEVSVVASECRLSGDALHEAVAAADVVVDASDNFTTRFALNAACCAAKVPLVSGAAIRSEGQLSVFDFRRPDSPCYRCLYHDSDDAALNCAESGVLAPLVGMVGSMQAIEALKCLAGFGDTLVGRLLLIDAATMEIRQLRLAKDPACPVCSAVT